MSILLDDPRFEGIRPFQNKIWLSSPTMHGEEQKWVDEAILTNWVSTVGANINEVEEQIANYLGTPFTVAVSSGTSALHLAIRMAGERLYGKPAPNCGSLDGHRVFASDMTFSATVNPIAYEGGEAVFIDTERDTWNMDPNALEKAFEKYPEVRLIVVAHLYGTPCQMERICEIARKHDALIVEDAAESLGAALNGKMTGGFGDYGVISFNGNKMITGSSGGMLLCHNKEDADKARKWSTQSREKVDWYEHEELGYNYRMSNIIAGVVRGQLPHLEEHIAQKKEIYMRYKEGLSDLPITMNPYAENSTPNYWLSCILIDEDALCLENETSPKTNGKTCPSEILSALKAFNIEGRPIWKPMHLQPLYKKNTFVSIVEDEKDQNTFLASEADVGKDIFSRGLCLPSDNKITEKQQDVVIDIIHRCFLH